MTNSFLESGCLSSVSQSDSWTAAFPAYKRLGAEVAACAEPRFWCGDIVAFFVLLRQVWTGVRGVEVWSGANQIFSVSSAYLSSGILRC